MNRLLNKKLAMAARSLEFLRAHPFTDRGQAAVATQFAALLAEAEALALAEQKVRLAAAAAKRHAAELRRGLEGHVLPGMERIGAFALRGDAPAASRFAPLPGRNAAAFVVRASNLLDAARAYQDVLGPAGLPRSQVAELANGLTQFREALALAGELRQQHHDTRIKLDRAMAQLLEQLRLFDAFNLVRFRETPELLERWAALRVVGRGARHAKSGEGEAPAVGEAPVSGVVVPRPGGEEPPGEGRPSAAA